MCVLLLAGAQRLTPRTVNTAEYEKMNTDIDLEKYSKHTKTNLLYDASKCIFFTSHTQSIFSDRFQCVGENSDSSSVVFSFPTSPLLCSCTATHGKNSCSIHRECIMWETDSKLLRAEAQYCLL